MQEADLVVHGPDLAPGILELARRDAERKVSGDPVADALSAAREGSRVVLLVPGAGAEMPADLASLTDLSVEHVPGIG